jgi:hypothetical protein
MAASKVSGLGDDMLFGGYHIGGDVQTLSISTPLGVLEVTDITQFAKSRLGGLRDGNISLTAYLDPAAGQAHAAFSPLTLSDVVATYLRGQAIGNPAFCLNSKLIGYDPTRAADGSVTEKVDCQANAFGGEWGEQLTAGVRTDTTGTNGTAQNDGAATPWGAQAYLQAVSVTGTSCTVTIQHSPDNSTWITLLAFAAQSSAPGTQRAATFAGPFTATNASPAVFTVPGSAFANGTPVALAANPAWETALPGGFSAATEYFVVSASGTSFSLAATSGGSAINSSSAGAGVITQAVQQYLRVITAGTFSSFAFQVTLCRNKISGVSF